MAEADLFFNNKNMKKSLLLFAITVIATTMMGQTTFPIPSANVKTLDGKVVNTSKFNNNGKPMIISFWATWCKPCKKELDAIDDLYEEWQKETGVKLIAVSTDDSRSSSKVATDVRSMGWQYEVYMDENQDFK